MSWEKVKLEDLCISITDGDHQSLPLAENGIPFIVIADINSNNRIDFSNARYVPLDYYEKLDKKRKPQKGDVLLTVKGSFGIPVYVADDTPFVFQRDIAILKCNEKINPRFLYYYMKNREFYLYTDSIAIGAAQRAITLKALKNTIIRLPPLDTQAGIVNLLSAYDDLIENNQKQIKLLEEAAQRLYKEWFVDLRFPGYENPPIVDGVPEGWRLSAVGECSVLLRRGISPKYAEDGLSTVINQKCIRQSVMDLSEARKQEKPFAAEMNLMDSDTVICSTGAGTLGRVGQVFGEYPHTTFDSHVTLVRASDAIGKQYLYQFLKAKQDYLQGMGKGSTNQLELSRGTIQELPILVPYDNIQRVFEQQMQPIHDKITALTKQIKLLCEARDSLLPKLMNGEIEV